MKIYLATTSHKPEKAMAYMRKVESRGHTITYDWTQGIPLEKEMDAAGLGVRAFNDTAGVQQADFLVVVMQKKMKEKMTGAALEIGVAIGAGVPVIIAEEECEFDHFFATHPRITRFDTLDSVLDFLEDQSDQK